MKYLIQGKMRIHKEWRKFSKEVEADTEKYARELVYSLLGSQNGVKRSEVKIESVSPITEN